MVLNIQSMFIKQIWIIPTVENVVCNFVVEDNLGSSFFFSSEEYTVHKHN